MLFAFPIGTLAIVCTPYQRPYEDPISLKAGDLVLIDFDKTKETDILGWSWCTGPDGRQGWVPSAWLQHQEGVGQIVRDFSALELTLKVGDQVTLHYSESGFVFVTHEDGSVGWVPDACLQLIAA
jgi:Variant SH3 domain